jgi:hypothetical protein
MGIEKKMDRIQCLECYKEFGDLSTLHRHLKAHKMSQRDYYVKYFPRYDKFDKSLINFKSRDFYLTSDFNSRINMGRWLNQIPIDKAQSYVRELLLDRKTRKNLVYSMCQVELRTLPMPGMLYMNKLFGSYYDECAKLGFVNKYAQIGLDGTLLDFAPHHKILVDTREQLPLSFRGLRVHTASETLPFGDYKLNDDAFSHDLVIERKTISDFYGTFSGGFGRFEAEVFKARITGAYMVVLIEGSLDNVYDFAHRLKMFNSHISPEYIFHNARQLIQTHSMVQLLFVEDRGKASEVAVKLFKCNGQFKIVDLQYAVDIGIL